MKKSIWCGIAVALLLASPVFAQTPDDPDAESCTDSKLLTRMSGCKILECELKDFDEATIQTKPGSSSENPAVLTTLEGVVEVVRYVCPTPGRSPIMPPTRGARRTGVSSSRS